MTETMFLMLRRSLPTGRSNQIDDTWRRMVSTRPLAARLSCRTGSADRSGGKEERFAS